MEERIEYDVRLPVEMRIVVEEGHYNIRNRHGALTLEQHLADWHEQGEDVNAAKIAKLGSVDALFFRPSLDQEVSKSELS